MVAPSSQPIVLVFAGPSGHGKTELALRLEDLISVQMERVDCTGMRCDWELFGAMNPWRGYEKGSPLNDFLVKRAGSRCIVFLDEVDKMDADIYNSLLIPFDEGKYQDRVTRKMGVDCSRVIWILATNAFDSIIKEFCDTNTSALFSTEDSNEKRRLVEQLCETLEMKAIDIFGAPLAGRITDFIPFLEFSHGERAVVAQKSLAMLGKTLARPIRFSENMSEERLVGDIDMRVDNDYTICRLLAEGYKPQTGARSIMNFVNQRVKAKVVRDYCFDVEPEVTSDQAMATYCIRADVDKKKVEVCRSPSSSTKNTGDLEFQALMAATMLWNDVPEVVFKS